MYITIGRNPQSDIVITGYDTVSFDHATIEYSNGQFLFIDDSRNGTLINGKLYKCASCLIGPNDTIMLAGVCPLPWNRIASQIPSQQSAPTPEGRPTNMYYEANVVTPQPAYNPQPSDNHPIQPQKNLWQQMEQSDGIRQHLTPRQLDKWNWGAFLLGWIWGIFNNVYWTLIALIPIPFCGLIVSIIAGIKGTRQSWENGRWNNSEYKEFAQKQKGWAIAGFVVLGLMFLSGIIFWSTLATILSHLI